MNHADVQVLSAIQKLPYPPDVCLTKLAGIVQSLCQQVDNLERRIKTLMEQQGLLAEEVEATQDHVAHVTRRLPGSPSEVA